MCHDIINNENTNEFKINKTHSAFSTLLIFHTPHFLHSSFFTLRTFHTPHSALLIIHRTKLYFMRFNTFFSVVILMSFGPEISSLITTAKCSYLKFLVPFHLHLALNKTRLKLSYFLIVED